MTDLTLTALNASPFLKLLNVRDLERSDGRAQLAVKIEDQHLRSRGIMHGGVGAALLDTTMGAAASTKTPDRHYTVTVQLNVNFIRPAWRGEELQITAEVLHAGQQTAVTRGEIRTISNTLVASGTATFMFVRDPAPDREILPRHTDRSDRDVADTKS